MKTVTRNSINCKTKRIKYIDLFRGIGILIMMLDHIYIGNIFSYFIHSFHMPMFFFVSGYFFNDSEIRTYFYIKKKAKKLLLPYLIVGIIHFIIWSFLNFNNFSFLPLKSLVWINTNDTLPIANALWFLTALFITEITYYIINKYINSLLIKTLLIILLTIGGMLLPTILPFTLPWGINAGMVGLGHYYFGYLLRGSNNKIILKVTNVKLLSCLVAGTFTALLIFLNDYVNMRMGYYGYFPLFWINSLLSILVGLNLCKIIEQFKTDKSMLETFIKWIQNIGENSIIYLCFNQLMIMCIRYLLSFVSLSVVIENILIFIIVILLLYMLNKFILFLKII